MAFLLMYYNLFFLYAIIKQNSGPGAVNIYLKINGFVDIKYVSLVNKIDLF